MAYLVQVALGPVQDFIYTARRSRDLYAGSRLLSEAAGAAAAFLAGELGYENLIFPAPNNAEHFRQLSQSGIPNVVLAWAPGKPDCRALAAGALEAAKKCVLEKGREVLGEYQALIDWSNAEKQLADMLEAYWACVPFEGEQDYAQARNRIVSVIAARKNTRDFAPVSWGSSLPKSSLDGARETVIAGVSESWKRRVGIRAGEELSGVDLVKRLWPGRAFLSTSHVAALPYLEGLEKQGKTQALQFYLERLADLVGEGAREEWAHPVVRDTILRDFDPRLLFVGRLDEFFEGPSPNLEAARSVCGEMYRELGEPVPYYALLHADGDRMGETIDHQSQQGVKGHRRLSNQLALGFAGKVQRIVENHQGCLVFSGGDDVLALLPLHRALPCAKALAQTFREAMKGFGKTQDPTLSVGLAIVHHLEPLQDALELVRRTEKLAKEGPRGTPPEQKRNALAIAYSPRSGSERMVRGRWDEAPSLTQRLYRYQDLFRLEQLPAKAAHELKTLLDELGEVEGMEQALVLEAKRILKRKELKPGYLQELDVLKAPADVARLADELIIAKVLARAYEQAQVPLEDLEVYRAH
ncbi:MAG: type III-B CRISPR-associated protein Cas10/Cmr2 [Meiothermus sp.]|uniref:type III-B CRISPR-associated protein Cas10/Cmr2 n=1 Tax=Meiothermus sp. TaxID=1955249 RepID=UPI0025F1DEF8|nr:type III-B CRISPR-associated protein Cas10/Cmr2 [Meiothermus sp.]MCS7069585.1 type III-B CRISPR-associated protein Cas10/Cmr2 [Meiothermus sp.]MDW8425980.1 type III-B CRISPR-associated protein Cas10/Cmr2 [Meiothermus sp.]